MCDVIEIWFENGIVCGKYLVHNLTFENAKEMVQKRLNIYSHLKHHLLLVDLSNIQTVSREARAYMASEKGREKVKAAAIIVKSPAQKLIANFFYSVSKPKTPIKLFTNKYGAVKWLKSFD